MRAAFSLLLTALWMPMVFAADVPLDHAHEQTLGPYPWAAVSTDVPIRGLWLDGEHGLWMIGRKSLWKWELVENTLQRLPLGTPNDKGAQAIEGSSLVAITTDGHGVVVASDRELLRLTVEPFKLWRVDHPGGNTGRTLALVPDGDDIWWVHQAGLAVFNRHTRELKAVGPALPALGPGAILFQPGVRRLLQIEGPQIKSWMLEKDHWTAFKTFFQARNTFLGLASEGSGLAAWTAHTVLRFEADGKIAQTIPVEGKHKLLRVALGAHVHAYLFDDGLLEWYALASKTERRFRTPEESMLGASALAADDRFVVMTVAGKPRVLAIEPPVSAP